MSDVQGMIVTPHGLSRERADHLKAELTQRQRINLFPGERYELSHVSIIAEEMPWRRWIDRGAGFLGGVFVTLGTVLAFFAAILLEW